TVEPISYEGKASIMGKGTNPVAFTAAADVATAVEQQLKRGPSNKRHVLRGPEALSLREVAALYKSVNQTTFKLSRLQRPLVRIMERLMQRANPSGQPIPVQPMKAIAAIAVAAGLSGASVMWAGVAMGVMLVGLACVPGVDRWIARVPRLWVAAIQAGVGLKLAWLGVSWMASLSGGAVNGVWVAVALLGVLLVWGHRRPWVVIAVLMAGVAWLAWTDGLGEAPAIDHETGRWFDGVWSTEAAWVGVTQLALPQLPLTVLNSVIAVCALSALYYPGRGVSPRRMAASVGVMNLIACPLGGIPMCHGAGGLAAQHHFGARTGGAVVMLGAAKIALALLMWPWVEAIVSAYPMACLAPLIVIAGGRLALASREAWHGQGWWVVAVSAGCVVAFGTLWGFGVAVLGWGVLKLMGKTDEPGEASASADRDASA
ncbi:MAG: molybdate transporter family protein, partial [Planctomycetota bacterium]